MESSIRAVWNNCLLFYLWPLRSGMFTNNKPHSGSHSRLAIILTAYHLYACRNTNLSVEVLIKLHPLSNDQASLLLSLVKLVVFFRFSADYAFNQAQYIASMNRTLDISEGNPSSHFPDSGLTTPEQDMSALTDDPTNTKMAPPGKLAVRK